MRTYNRIMNGQTFSFRLTVGAQKGIEKKFGTTLVQFIFDCADSVEKMTYLLGAAANFKGNENPTVDGDEIFDLLVDDGVGGQDGFCAVAVDIAAASGILSETLAAKSKEGVEKAMNELAESLGPTKEPEPELAKR